MKNVAIIGASLAGLAAARALRDQGFDGAVTIVGGEPHRPYDRPPLSKAFLAGSVDEAELLLEDDGEDLAANWLLGVRAVALDPVGQRVQLSDGSELTADGVVIATGAAARWLPGAPRIKGAHVLRTLDDAYALRAELRPGARLVIIGAGFIGAEVASTARRLGLQVTVVEAAPTPLSLPVGPSVGARLAGLHAEHGTTLQAGVGVAGLTGSDRVTGVELVDGRRLPADVVVIGIGAAPEIGWLNGSGINVGDGIVCDSGGASSIPSVVAVGDCAAWFDPLSRAHVRIEHWAGAVERADIAVATLLAGGRHAGGPAPQPYFWSDQYGSRIQFAGSMRADDDVVIEEGDKGFLAVYYRQGSPVAVLGVDQTRQFTQFRRQLVRELPATRSGSEAQPPHAIIE
jgi:NADPH-dependent 2,4-dienoyl-CoA reductase/sulfur reductase-like enzyme